ncbi:hypothetical protein BX661DRAFT_170936 [Kickxella alabastrina]|uniref:uncharacterized protein n=1 Tax=Kickxella alabastrina TaxID=61397 RepID=UPI00221EB77B|nr:uncharacterized protein BX661DRAFT_172408 [Kickxella alabastrina]XP_051392043.1 uncharacterized protein BX661DRAFT_170936 [Kickxella alabastrina]KAI7824603.1 hypothetical protein BX661DRAFT_172408 [Kickxella alabastrina]KAI7828519.1 hypothetical protein BX661DRAFT_170936 [Kickxella alabastrina]
MHLAGLFFGALVLTFASAEMDAVADNTLETSILKDAVFVSSAYNEQQKAISLNLLNRIATYISSSATIDSEEPNKLINIDNILLSDLDIDNLGDSKKLVKDLYNKVHVQLSNDYRYTFNKPAAMPTTTSSGTSSATASQSMLMIPFGSLFSFGSGNIKYVAELLDTLSRVDPLYVDILAPMFGISGEGLKTPESSKLVARLLKIIGGIGDRALVHISGVSASNINDPLTLNGKFLMRLSNILAMDAKHVNQITELFISISEMRVIEMKLFLKDLGWDTPANNVWMNPKPNEPGTMPNFSYILTLGDQTLMEITRAAKSYTPNNVQTKQDMKALKTSIIEAMDKTRYFWSEIQNQHLSYFTTQTADPIRSTLVQLTNIGSKNIGSSNWQLSQFNFNEFGKPITTPTKTTPQSTNSFHTLPPISELPAQQISSLASAIFGESASAFMSNYFQGILIINNDKTKYDRDHDHNNKTKFKYNKYHNNRYNE